MGDSMPAPTGTVQTFLAESSAPADAHIRFFVDGKETASTPSKGGAASSTLIWTSDGKRHWIRAELATADGAPVTVTNPIFVNWP